MTMEQYKSAASPTAVYVGIILLVIFSISGIKTGQYPPEYMVIAIVGMIGVRMAQRGYERGKAIETGGDFS